MDAPGLRAFKWWTPRMPLVSNLGFWTLLAEIGRSTGKKKGGRP